MLLLSCYTLRCQQQIALEGRQQRRKNSTAIFPSFFPLFLEKQDSYFFIKDENCSIPRSISELEKEGEEWDDSARGKDIIFPVLR